MALSMSNRLRIGSLVILLSLSLSANATAHAIIMDSLPRADEVLTNAPERLVLRFNSRIVPSLSRVTLLGPDRRKLVIPSVGQSAASQEPDRLLLLLPLLQPGKYLVEWQVLSVDGHVTRGAFFFRYDLPPEGR